MLRLSEVMTETIDVAGINASLERDARLSLGVDHVWVEDDKPVKLKIRVEPISDAAATGGEPAGGSEKKAGGSKKK